jgi:hypothetical protein
VSLAISAFILAVPVVILRRLFARLREELQIERAIRANR